ncbi:MAG: glycosyltransferase family 2 protein [Anaerolineae bacterium]|jgi:rhamnosyltransferase|nr:glycosyltransferase family 2 protein [Anaerolineae bacterium]MBT7073398.1 glycosyltransferase family 2 protein [Anaerolineae bacterium]MBT7783436.1 glycosyltransferase family 2 protein [Anaerolineae bacterium]
MKCSVVVRAFNEAKDIGRLLEGIKQQNLENIEVILVDSGSTDATVAIAESFDAKIVHITPEEFTFGRSLNYGVEAARGEFIVNISAHCYPVYPDWLEELLKPFEDEKLAVSYGKQRGGVTNQYSEHQFFKQYFPDISQPNQGHPYSHNANAAIRKSLWEEHPYNEALTGLEDLAWSSWAMEEGYSIAYVADAEIIHAHDEKPAQVHNRYRREAIAMKAILPKSTFSLWNFLRLWLSSTYSDLVQAKREKVLKENSWSIFWFRFLQYLGTYQGYNYSGQIDAQLHQGFYYPPGILSEKTPAPRTVEPIAYEN